MTNQPQLRTERLLLRPFTLADAPNVQKLAGSKAIADTTLHIPYPYPDGQAERWISAHAPRFRDGRGAIFAITLPEDGLAIGSIGLVVVPDYQRAGMGYWLGQSYWGLGYMTEAARKLLHYGFTELGLNRICADYFSRNPASGRVMEKIGMRYEGTLRQHVVKWGKFEDLKMYGILKSEFEERGLGD
jgi:[ribosomal protein S5]-alanine N-acetyltransferase